MKKKLLSSLIFLTLICTAWLSKAQTQKLATTPTPVASKKNKKPQTAVFTIDLGLPTDSTVRVNLERKSIWAYSREPISFKLVNGNPFKYKYVINSNIVNLFQSASATPLEDLYKKTQDNAKAAASTDTAIINAAAVKAAVAKLTAEFTKDSTALAKLSSVKTGTKKTKKANTKALSDTTVGTTATTKTNQRLSNVKDSLNTIYKSIGLSVIKNVNAIIKDSIFSKSSKAIGVKVIDSSLVVNNKNKLNSTAVKDTLADFLNKGILVLLQSAVDLNYEVTEYKLHVANEDFLDTIEYGSKKKYFLNTMLLIRRRLGDLNISIQTTAPTNTTIIASLTKLNNELTDVGKMIDGLINIQTAHYTLPNDINGKNIDLLKMTIERHDFTSNALIDKSEYQVWINGGFKIDVSAGLFITSVMDNKYFTVDADNSTTSQPLKYIYRSNMGAYGLGFGSMVDLSYRTGAAWVRPAVSLGALVSATQKFQGLAGISLMLGKEERCVFHWGLSLGTVTSLETSYTTSDDKNKKSYSLGASNQVPTSDHFTFGNFFGFTYNISGAKIKVPSLAPTADN